MAKQIPNTIFMIANSLSSKGGGVTNVILNRSKDLAKEGLGITVLTLYYIESENKKSEPKLRKQGRLHPNVNLINIYEWYRNKNTVNSPSLLQKIRYFMACVPLLDIRFRGKITKKRSFSGFLKLDRVDYYNKNNKLFKSAIYDGVYIESVTKYDIASGGIDTINQYTPDGYRFITNKPYAEKDRVILYDRESSKKIKFKRTRKFEIDWIEHLCNEQQRKPIIIVDGLDVMFKATKIDDSLAHIIYTINSNHHRDPYNLDAPLTKRHGIIFSKLDQIESLVVLTKTQRDDIVKKVGDFGNISIIPNYIRDIADGVTTKDPHTFTVISRLVKSKCLDQTIKAVHKVKNKYSNIRLNIYGEGDEYEYLSNMVNDLSLKDNVFFKGHIDVKSLDEETKKSLATIVTTKTEGFSLAILESMACGTPAISYDVNYGPRDLIENNVTGFLIKYGDIDELAKKMIYALNNPDKMKSMGQKAKKDVYSKYSSNLVVSKWINLLSKVSESN